MNLYIQDLGPKWQIALIRRRLSFTGQAGLRTHDEQSAHPPIGPLGRWWTGGLGLTREVTEATLEALKRRGSAVYCSVCAVGTAIVTVGVAIYFGQESFSTEIAAAIVGEAVAGLMLVYPKIEVSCIRQPVTGDEILLLRDGTKDPLERDYLGLIQDIQRQTLIKDAAKEVRGAVRALGQALSQLPPSGAASNGEALREMSAQKRAEMETETDAVIVASLERQAAALRRSADTAERSARLQRRTATLRDELSAQIESLRLGLTSFQTTSGDVSGLAELADAVQTVAAQTAAIDEARAELDVALQGRLVCSQPVTQTLLAGEN